MQAAVGEVEEQEENLARRKEKRREERENRVSEDHSNINVPGPEKRRHSLIKKLEKLIHISLGARGLCYSSFNPWYLIGHLFPAISNLAPLPVFFFFILLFHPLSNYFLYTPVPFFDAASNHHPVYDKLSN